MMAVTGSDGHTGSSVASARSQEIRVRVPTRFWFARAVESGAGSMSTPSTVAGPRSAAPSASMPVPHPRSTTVPPAMSPLRSARWTRCAATEGGVRYCSSDASGSSNPTTTPSCWASSRFVLIDVVPISVPSGLAAGKAFDAPEAFSYRSTAVVLSPTLRPGDIQELQRCRSSIDSGARYPSTACPCDSCHDAMRSSMYSEQSLQYHVAMCVLLVVALVRTVAGPHPTINHDIG